MQGYWIFFFPVVVIAFAIHMILGYKTPKKGTNNAKRNKKIRLYAGISLGVYFAVVIHFTLQATILQSLLVTLLFTMYSIGYNAWFSGVRKLFRK